MACVEKMGKYTLIITEKPDAAQRIASALDADGKPRKMYKNQMPYYVAKRERDIVVVPALGHLYTVTSEKGQRSHYPVFSFRWVPIYEAERKAKLTRPWIAAISKLAENADTFIDACDYDIEGSLIGYNILKHACNNKEQQAKRMKYSTLTKEELEKSYAEPLSHLDFAIIEAGQTRHEVDWLYGINLSRALTTAAKNHSGRYVTLSTGRVQGPTLKFVTSREKTIRTFVPTPYWTINALIQLDSQTFEARYEKEKIETKREAEAILNTCKGKNGQVKNIATKQFQQLPPAPFDLGTLQAEAYRLFKYTPKQTSNIAQHLYLDALISYPRTGSQKLPPSINYPAILKNLDKTPEYRALAAELLAKPKLKPNDGKKDDPAHPAIYPTGNLPPRSLSQAERKLWDLIVRRFMATFSEPATRQTINVTININEHRFCLDGIRTLKEGWIRFYEPYASLDEVILPPLKEDQIIKVKTVTLEDRFTAPPPRYNPANLLKTMEKAEIGTKATRADTIQTLYNRNYITDEKITATDLGFETLSVLEKYCPTVVSIALTRELEEKMNNIQLTQEKRETILSNTIEILKPVLQKLRENEKTIGEQLNEALKRSIANERTLGSCPTCKTGKLTIIYSRTTGKRFIGCTNYFKGKCKTSFPLLQKGSIKPTDKICSKCRWPTIQIRTNARRPWILCFNPQCPSKKEKATRR